MTGTDRPNTYRLIMELEQIAEYMANDHVRQVIDKSAERLREYSGMSLTEAEEVGPEEYYGPELVCRRCKTQWMAFDENGIRLARYCPGCGREVTVVI